MNATELKTKFKALFGQDADAVMYAPGRVNLIGEHTDYNDGFVLPCAISFKNIIAYRKRDDAQVNIYSVNYDDDKHSFTIDQDIIRGDQQWANYVKAVAYVLKKRGHTLNGVDMVMFGDVPQGGGLSSSAALEVCVGGVFNDISTLGLNPTEIAQIGQQAENEFMDCQCGIMDQLISANGQENCALLIDCEDFSFSPISVPEDLSVVIVNSNFKRELVDSEYNTRRTECEEAAKAIGVKSLRYATLEQLKTNKEAMSELAFKRGRHVITENARTTQAAEALKTNDFDSLRGYINASHDSLRDDFEVTVPATDGLVQICRQALGEDGAARMTGGGFGGCIVCLCKPEKVDSVLAAIEANYEKQFGLVASAYVCKADKGMHKIV